MKRLHIHLFVTDISTSTHFYNHLFASQPTLSKEDYVRWELTDPPMNFAISNHGTPGIDHLGIQNDSNEELEQLIAQYKSKQTSTVDVEKPEESTCCYAHSTKSWLSDPQGIQWELFTTHHNETEFFGKESSSSCCNGLSACC